MTDLTLVPDLDTARERLWRNVRVIEFAQDYPGTLGRAIRRKREAKGWSMAKLASKIGVTRQHLWEVEAAYGSNFTMIQGMPNLIAVLDLTIDDLEAEAEEADHIDGIGFIAANREAA